MGKNLLDGAKLEKCERPLPQEVIDCVFDVLGGYDPAVSVIPPELLRRLKRVSSIVDHLGGTLRSRQAIAIIIEQYEREVACSSVLSPEKV